MRHLAPIPSAPSAWLRARPEDARVLPPSRAHDPVHPCARWLRRAPKREHPCGLETTEGRHLYVLRRMACAGRGIAATSLNSMWTSNSAEFDSQDMKATGACDRSQHEAIPTLCTDTNRRMCLGSPWRRVACPSTSSSPLRVHTLLGGAKKPCARGCRAPTPPHGKRKPAWGARGVLRAGSPTDPRRSLRGRRTNMLATLQPIAGLATRQRDTAAGDKRKRRTREREGRRRRQPGRGALLGRAG